MVLPAIHRRPYRLFFALVFCLAVSYLLFDPLRIRPRGKWKHPFGYVVSSFDWAGRREKYPVSRSSMAKLPSGSPLKQRRIQHDFSQDAGDVAFSEQQTARRAVIRNTFRKCWESYRQYSWGYDELRPTTLLGADTFGGWGATLVDGLDTLHIMDLPDEFDQAVFAISSIDWDNSTAWECSLFETNIRYLGGLLSAFELSGNQVLLDKALELAHLLYAAFDTPNRMPVNRLDFARAKMSTLVASDREVAASVGTLSLEFTKLSQITGDAKFFDATERIKKQLLLTQDQTKLPGMWPVYIDLQAGFGVSDTDFTLGALADSLYEVSTTPYCAISFVPTNARNRGSSL